MTPQERLDYNRKYYVLCKAWKQGLLSEYPFNNGVPSARKKKAPLQDHREKGFTRKHGDFVVSFKHPG